MGSVKDLKIMLGNAKLAKLGFRFKSAEQVREAYHKGALDKDHAEYILTSEFGME